MYIYNCISYLQLAGFHNSGSEYVISVIKKKKMEFPIKKEKRGSTGGGGGKRLFLYFHGCWTMIGSSQSHKALLDCTINI